MLEQKSENNDDTLENTKSLALPTHSSPKWPRCGHSPKHAIEKALYAFIMALIVCTWGEHLFQFFRDTLSLLLQLFHTISSAPFTNISQVKWQIMGFYLSL